MTKTKTKDRDESTTGTHTFLGVPGSHANKDKLKRAAIDLSRAAMVSETNTPDEFAVYIDGVRHLVHYEGTLEGLLGYEEAEAAE